jgi:hypothetical protein
MTIDFKGFPKMARLSRDIIVTEKIDGTNAQVYVTPEGELFAGSRTRWITPEQDNFGFARWVQENRDELLTLGPGQHFGEWWGKGIQRGYGLEERRFSLFNTLRWVRHGDIPLQLPTLDPRVTRLQEVLPPCCDLVPVLYQGPFLMQEIALRLSWLKNFGSYAAPKFMNPEGVVVFHTAGNVAFKKTIEKDEMPKALAHKEAS